MALQTHLLVALTTATCLCGERLDAATWPLAPDFVGQRSNLGDLNGGEQQRRLPARLAHLLAEDALALGVAADAVLAYGPYQPADRRPETFRQLVRTDIRVLRYAVQQPGGDDDIRAAGIAQQAGDRRNMLDERRTITLPPLTDMTARRIRKSDSRQGQSLARDALISLSA